MLNWRPNPGRQEAFHASYVDELFYGGQAGGGKSESGLIEALRYVHVPGYRAMLFRRTFPELAQQDGLIDRSKSLYPEAKGTYNKSDHLWTFPSGATIGFGHMEHVDDRYKYKSAQFAYIFFDELTTFEREQYMYLFSRCRTTAIDPFTNQVIPARLRSGSNPGDVGHEWVFERFIAHLEDPNLMTIKWFLNVDDVDTEVPEGTRFALSRQYIPASLYDNPKLLNADPMYEARLMALPLIERERLLRGNWEIKTAGNVFHADWFNKVIYYTPQDLKWVRYWDLAASTKTKADFTACAAIAIDKDANIYIRDMYNTKLEWPDAKKLIKNEIMTDPTVVKVGIEKKLHGLAAWQELIRDRDLVGKTKLVAVDVDMDKLSRALLWSAPAEAGKVILVDGPWIRAFMVQCATFDGTGKSHDDMVDTVSGGVKMIGKQWRTTKFLHL